MRRIALVVLVALGLGAGAALVWAGSAQKDGRVDHQSLAWTTDDVLVTPDWTTVETLTAQTGCQENRRASAAVSLSLTPGSSPVDVRVTMRDPLVVCTDCEEPILDVLRPGRVPFNGTSSFTFVTGRSAGDHGTVFAVQVRLPEDAQPNASATIDKGTLNVLWKGFERGQVCL